MKSRLLRYLMMAFFLSLWLGCGGSADDATEENATTQQTQSPSASTPADTEDTPAETEEEENEDEGETDPMGSMASAVQQAQQAMQQAQQAMSNADGVEPISFRQLTPLFPDLPDVGAGTTSGETNNMMGMKMSQAKAEYPNGITISIVDPGTMTGIVRMMGYAWLEMEIDREDNEGFERTATCNGFPCYEESKWDDSNSESQVYVGDRFIVAFSGPVSMEELVEARDAFPFDDLLSMKDQGAED